MKRWTLRDILPLSYFTKVENPSERYLKGIASYGKKVKSEKRKERILAELKAMGVKPRVRRKAVCVKVKTFGFPKRAQPSIYVVNPPMYVGVKRGVVFAYNRREAT